MRGQPDRLRVESIQMDMAPLRLLSGSEDEELAAVFRFRYDYHFKTLADGYPGVDHCRRMVVEPHDYKSTHMCAFGADGTLLAVSTSVPASLPCIPGNWADWLGFSLLTDGNLSRTVVNTRMVLHPAIRGTAFFYSFRFNVLMRCRENGFQHALHYCDPILSVRYEALGHRRFHKPFEILPGLVRIPMMFNLSEIKDHAGAIVSTHHPLQDATPCGTLL